MSISKVFYRFCEYRKSRDYSNLLHSAYTQYKYRNESCLEKSHSLAFLRVTLKAFKINTFKKNIRCIRKIRGMFLILLEIWDQGRQRVLAVSLLRRVMY